MKMVQMSQPGSSYFVCDKFFRERKFTRKFTLKLSITIATDLERRSIRLAQLFPEPIEVKVDVEWLHGGHNVTGQAQQGRLVQAGVELCLDLAGHTGGGVGNHYMGPGGCE